MTSDSKNMLQTDIIYREWAHAPSHLFVPGATYFVTSATYNKVPIFNTVDRLDYLQSVIFEQVQLYDWRLEAWAVMANHYHFVARAPGDAKNLGKMLGNIHSLTARNANIWDQTEGRQVWHQYWDTCLTYLRSYYARIHYVIENPVKHRLVDRAENYRWSSACWFATHGKPGYRRTVLSFPCDKLGIQDDY